MRPGQNQTYSLPDNLSGMQLSQSELAVFELIEDHFQQNDITSPKEKYDILKIVIQKDDTYNEVHSPLVNILVNEYNKEVLRLSRLRREKNVKKLWQVHGVITENFLIDVIRNGGIDDQLKALSHIDADASAAEVQFTKLARAMRDKEGVGNRKKTRALIEGLRVVDSYSEAATCLAESIAKIGTPEEKGQALEIVGEATFQREELKRGPVSARILAHSIVRDGRVDIAVQGIGFTRALDGSKDREAAEILAEFVSVHGTDVDKVQACAYVGDNKHAARILTEVVRLIDDPELTTQALEVLKERRDRRTVETGMKAIAVVELLNSTNFTVTDADLEYETDQEEEYEEYEEEEEEVDP